MRPRIRQPIRLGTLGCDYRYFDHREGGRRARRALGNPLAWNLHFNQVQAPQPTGDPREKMRSVQMVIVSVGVILMLAVTSFAQAPAPAPAPAAGTVQTTPAPAPAPPSVAELQKTVEALRQQLAALRQEVGSLPKPDQAQKQKDAFVAVFTQVKDQMQPACKSIGGKLRINVTVVNQASGPATTVTGSCEIAPVP